MQLMALEQESLRGLDSCTQEMTLSPLGMVTVSVQITICNGVTKSVREKCCEHFTLSFNKHKDLSG